jgi:two-component system KDP operon response regulator KdpE
VSHSTGARVLVVDDEPATLRIVQTNLGHHEYRVDTAASSEAALEAYNRLRPDLVLLDLGLPDMDGLEVLRSIRQRASTPIVVLSRAASRADSTR